MLVGFFLSHHRLTEGLRQDVDGLVLASYRWLDKLVVLFDIACAAVVALIHWQCNVLLIGVICLHHLLIGRYWHVKYRQRTDEKRRVYREVLLKSLALYQFAWHANKLLLPLSRTRIVDRHSYWQQALHIDEQRISGHLLPPLVQRLMSNLDLAR